MKTGWERLQEAFEAARGLPPAERRPLLEERLGDDPDALRRVEAMLRADAADELPLDRRMETLADDLLGTSGEDGPEPPARVGPYRIVGTLGRGGMGTVYRGVRGDLDRSAAIKVLHGTFLSPLRRELFDRERRVLAALQHPSIAQLHDAGTLPDGTPWFVMEEIEGRPIDEACARRGLDVRERLRLFLQVCEAVQFAHARGVIHSDLKPTNLLVPDADGPATVKLLDFGIARRLDPDPESVPDPGDARAYTPAYAAPEQIAGRPATALTDVYALGVLLHELLAGERPRHAARRDGVQNDAPSAAAGRADGGGAAAWRELDAICARARASAPEERYPTVEALAADLRRFLAGRPVQALPPAPLYVARKLAGRHRAAVALAGTLAAAILVAAALLLVQSRRTAAERDRAERERAAAERVSTFVVDLFRAADPAQTRGQEVPARDLLDTAAAQLLRPRADQPGDRVRFLQTIARAYDHLGLYGEQAGLLRAALATPDIDGRRTFPTATLLRAELAGALLQLGELDEAEALLDAAAAAAPPDAGLDRLAVDGKLAHLRWLQGDLDRSEEIFLRVIPALEAEQGGERTQRYYECVANLGAVYSHQGRFAEAGDLYARAIAEMTRRVGADHPRTLMQRGNLAVLEIRRERFEEARALLVPLLADKRRVLGERHADTLRSVNGLAVVEHYLGNLDRAEELFREAIAVSEETLSPEHRDTLALVANLAAVLVERGKVVEGRDMHRRVWEGFRRDLGPRHRFTALTLHNLAGANLEAGDLETADEQYRRVQEVLEATLPENHPDLALNLEAWSELQGRLGRTARSEELAGRAAAIRAAAEGG